MQKNRMILLYMFQRCTGNSSLRGFRDALSLSGRGSRAAIGDNEILMHGTKISLPYTPTEAAACLAELTQLDEAGIAALSDTVASSRSTAQKVSQERDDLKCFAKTGECREAGKDTVSTEDMRRWAQRFLCWAGFRKNGFWRWSSSRRVIARGRRNWRPTWARGIPRGTCR